MDFAVIPGRVNSGHRRCRSWRIEGQLSVSKFRAVGGMETGLGDENAVEARKRRDLGRVRCRMANDF